MKKCDIVRTNKEFNDIIATKHFQKNQYFVVYYQEKKANQSRFGISVGKKIGNAVTRNKLKRQVRRIVDINKKNYSNELDYIIMVRKTCLMSSYQQMNEKLDQILKQISKKENQR